MLAPLIRLRYPDGALRVQDLDQLVAAAHQATDPRHFVAELVLDPPSSSADMAQPPHLDEDYLTISTIHSAKGLEWDSVHVLAVYDGNFPACMSAGTSEQIDEERRLLYVGMTRARRHADALRPRPLPPPPARPRRRPRLRQAEPLPDARGARHLRRHAAARRPAEPLRRADRRPSAASTSRPTRCSIDGRHPPLRRSARPV